MKRSCNSSLLWSSLALAAGTTVAAWAFAASASPPGGTEPAQSKGVQVAQAMPSDLPDDVLENSLGGRGTVLKEVPAVNDLATLLQTGPAGHAPANPNYAFWLNVPGTSFHPRDSGVSFTYAGGGCIYLTAGSQMLYPVLFPDGSTVALMRTYYTRTGSPTNTLFFTKYTTSTHTTNDVVNVPATGTTGIGTDSTTFTDVIDYTTYGYDLIWQGTASSANQFCGARLIYYMPPQGAYNAVTPCRVFDTRSTAPPNLTTAARSFQITGNCGVPAGATAVVGNFTVAEGTLPGYIAFWQYGVSWPGNSTLNYSASQIVANAAVVPLASNGQFQGRCYQGTVGVIFDVTGYYY